MTVLPDVELHFLPLAGLFLLLSFLFLLQSKLFPSRNKKNTPWNKCLRNTSLKHFPKILSCHFAWQFFGSKRRSCHFTWSFLDSNRGIINTVWPFFRSKKGHHISHNLKLILGIDPFYRQGRGVLNTPHMYLDFWSYVPLGDILRRRMQYAPTEIPNIPFCMILFMIKKMVMSLRIPLSRLQ